jgi:hypothetical protein
LQLLGYLRNLRSTLPSTEWVDDRSRLWVPSRIAVCLRMYRQGFETPVDLSVLLPLFPARAAELLGGREAIDDEVVRAGLAGVGISEGVTCFEMTLEEARTLSDELLAPSGPGTHAYWGILFRFDDQLAPLPADAKQAYLAAYVGFTELLPDGTPPRDPG